MKLYDASLDIRGLSDKANNWYNCSLQHCYKNIAGLYYIGYDRSNVEGPYTLQQIGEMFEAWQDEVEKEAALESWLNSDEFDDFFVEDEDDLMDGDLEDIFDRLMDDNLPNQIDRLLTEE